MIEILLCPPVAFRYDPDCKIESSNDDEYYREDAADAEEAGKETAHQGWGLDIWTK